MQRNTENETQNFLGRSAENENLRPMWCECALSNAAEGKACTFEVYFHPNWEETTCPYLGDCSEYLDLDGLRFQTELLPDMNLAWRDDNGELWTSEDRFGCRWSIKESTVTNMIEVDRDRLMLHNED
jgi:hypothetical protein